MAEPVYYVEFVGGALDARIACSSSNDPAERGLVSRIFFLTRGGMLEKSFHGVISAADIGASHRGELKPLPNTTEMTGTHKYTVIARQEDGNEVRIKLKYSVRPIGEGDYDD